jgi:hypothetical protein
MTTETNENTTDPDMIEVTGAEALCELRREAAMRRNVYRRWIDRQTMTRADALTHMARLEAAIEMLEDCDSLPARKVRVRL